MKDRFSEIIVLRKQIQDLFHRLEEKRKSMKDNYTTLVSNNDHHFFGLDSFRFQVKLAENELSFLNDQFVLIDNRLYCDYYKLYNHVYEYYIENLPTGITKSVYPIYKDLEPTKVYDTELVHKLYRDIIVLIHKAYETLDHEHRKRETEKRLTTSGIHIGNYVHNRVFTDTLIKTNIQLFEEYLNTYFIYHMTFLVNLKDRLGMFLDHVLRKQPTDQVSNSDELDDNFVQIAKDQTPAVVDEMFHSETKPEDVLTVPAEPKTDPPSFIETKELEPIAQEKDTVAPQAETKTEQISEEKDAVAPHAETKTEPDEQIAETKSDETEPVTDLVSSVVEPVSIPAEVSTEPVPDHSPVPEPAVEQSEVQVPEPVTEPVVDPVPEPVTEPVVEQSAVPLPEPVTEPLVDPVPEPVTEQSTVPLPEQIKEPAVEPESKDEPEEGEEHADASVQTSDGAERTVEEVINPIIDHILGNVPVPAKKKKRPRKPK